VEIREFFEFHSPVLEMNEPRHNKILGIFARSMNNPVSCFRVWSLGTAGACAVQEPGYSIVLGELDQQQCHMIAAQAHRFDFPGVVGPDRTATWFAEHVGGLGIAFAERIPLQIRVIRSKPHYPGGQGAPRAATSADADLVIKWLLEFAREATPYEPLPMIERIRKGVAECRYMFWTVNSVPVSIAGIVRRTNHGAAISNVYTPPGLRRRGYAGSVTAALVERVYGEGKQFACLYTDPRNPFSNRCYARVGFEPVCASWHYLRGQGRP
jgi:RimJ/RimL family protein N-acetyltransferase